MFVLQEFLIWILVVLVAYLCLRPLVRQIHVSTSSCSGGEDDGCRGCPMMLGSVEAKTVASIADIKNSN